MRTDFSTQSSYKSVDVKRTALNVEIEWSNKRLKGTALYELTTRDPTVILDTLYLEVFKVTWDGSEVQFDLGASNGFLGTPLIIRQVPVDIEGSLTIEFATTDKCTAAQWLRPEQTSDKIAPYLFTQGEAIHNRSLFPSFDTPALKSVYNIAIKSKWPVVATGLSTGEPTGGVYNFHQPVPIPSYLFAIASGNIVKRSIGPRSVVWGEPSSIEKCQWEFEADTEKFIEVAEKLVFPYEWKTYDVLVLPPSFPFGGMENPNMTFATPTLITGDRSLVDVIAHELSHSWSGNLVTSGTWADFHLNEGWTVYLERRIMGEIHGEAYRHFEALIGWKELIEALNVLDPKFTRLVVDMEEGAVNPDDSFSTVPYEKGSSFLWHLELTLSRARWDKYIPWYFSKFRYKSLDTDMFISSLYEFFNLPGEKEKLDGVDWATWLYKEGLPPQPSFDTSLAEPCYILADKWLAATENGDTSWADENDVAGWTSLQVVVFLDKLGDELTAQLRKSSSREVAAKTISTLGKLYKVQFSGNGEILSRWFRLAISAGVEKQSNALANWLGTVGRMKFVRPGYRQLLSVDRELAVETFKKNRDFYHPICEELVKKDIGLK